MYSVSHHGGEYDRPCQGTCAISRPLTIGQVMDEAFNRIGTAVRSAVSRFLEAGSVDRTEITAPAPEMRPVPVFNPAMIRFWREEGGVQTFLYGQTVIHAAFDGRHLFVQLDGMPEKSVALELLTWFGMDFQRPVTCFKLSPDARYYVQEKVPLQYVTMQTGPVSACA